MTQYIVLCGQVEGNMQTGFDIVYYFDGKRFRDREKAIKHGLEIRESDDFNIGILERGKLAGLAWMHEPMESEPGDLAKIAEQIGVRS